MNLADFFKFKKYYFKVFLYTVIISLIPILILSSFSYVNIKKNMKVQLNDSTNNYLKQCENIIEIILKQVDQSLDQLTIDYNFKEFENFYDGYYYETIKGEFKDEDLPILNKYLNSKVKVFDRLSVYKASNNFVDSVYFYDSSKNIVLTNNGLQYDFAKFYDKACLKGIESFRTFPMVLDTRQALQWDNKYKNIISIIYKTVNTKDKSNYIVVNIDAEYLFSNLSNKVENKIGRTFFILSGNNKVIIKGNDDYLYEEIISNSKVKDYLAIESGIFDQRINNKNYMITFIKNNFLNWTFITASSYNELYAVINYIRNLLISTTIILIILTIIAVVISSKNIYNPILNIVTYIKNNIRQDNSNENISEEIDYISNSIKMVHADYINIHHKLEKNLPDYKQRFIQSLLQYNTYKYEEIVEKMNFIGIELNTNDLVVLIVRIEDFSNSVDNLSQFDKVILKIKEITELTVQSYYNKGILVYVDKNKFAIVINCTENRFTDIFEFAENLKNELLKDVEIKVSIGISRQCDDILNLSHAYNEAIEALKYRLVSDNNDIIYIDDIKIRKKQFMIYPKEKIELINSCIRYGNKEEALKNFNEMINLFFSHNRYVYYSGMQQVFIRFLNSINNTINTLGIDLNDIFLEENLYQAIFKMNNLNHIDLWFQKVIGDITDYINCAVNEKKSKYLDQINTYLESNLENNITLNTIAEHLELNPSYVSRMFKESMGKNLIEYLTEYRIEKSKELLSSTNLKVQDICTRVGYSNSYYFIKIFKQHTGVTPGEYRKTLLSGQI